MVHVEPDLIVMMIIREDVHSCGTRRPQSGGDCDDDDGHDDQDSGGVGGFK